MGPRDRGYVFPSYDMSLVQSIREWCEVGRHRRYARFTRSIDEYLCELGYLIVHQNLELRQIISDQMSISSSIDKKTTALIKAQKYLQSAEQEIWIISKIADDFFRTGYNKKVKVKILTEEPKSAINHKIVKGTKIEIHRLEKISDTTLILIDKRVFLLFVPLKLSKEDIFLTIVTKGTTLVQTAIEMFLRLCSEIPAKR